MELEDSTMPNGIIAKFLMNYRFLFLFLGLCSSTRLHAALKDPIAKLICWMTRNAIR
jgi:hypothetical protein